MSEAVEYKEHKKHKEHEESRGRRILYYSRVCKSVAFASLDDRSSINKVLESKLADELNSMAGARFFNHVIHLNSEQSARGAAAHHSYRGTPTPAAGRDQSGSNPLWA